jgi:hypothetical protein
MAYPHLPGVRVNLNDLGLKIAPPPAGPKVTLLGVTSNSDIPVREPYTITNVGAASSSLYFSGAAGIAYPGELALGIDEAFGAGAGAVEIVVIAHKDGATLDSYIDPTNASGASERYSDLALAYEVIKDTTLNVVVPVGAWADATGVTGGYANQLANFCYQATADVDNACIGVIGMMPVPHWAYTWQNTLSGTATIGTEALALNNSGDFFFSSPSLELVTEWQRYAVQDSAAVVASTESNFPTVFEHYLAGSEDTAGTFHSTDNENAATDVNDSYWTSWRAVESDGSYATDQKGNKVDAGARISIIGAPTLTTNGQIKELAKGKGAALSNTKYITDAAAIYAGMLNALPPHSASTGKLLPNSVYLRPMSARQANELTGRRIVCTLNRPRGYVVASGITGAHNVSKYVRSDFVRLSTVRIVDAAIDMIRFIGEQFIGESNTAAHRNALAGEIDKALTQMKSVQALNDFQFFVRSTAEQQVLGEVDIDLTLVPAFELIQINVNVSLAKEV